jgi:hypothetical protein
MKKRVAKALVSMDDTPGTGYWKWHWLPSPKKLGMSKHNALGSREFGSSSALPTWEDWEEKVKTMYPVRYFLIEELIPLIKVTWRKYVWEPWYYLKCHIMKRHRYHMLDLRQPKQSEYSYRYGWLDSDHKMVYALFNILNTFVDKEMPHWHCPSDEEVEEGDGSLLDQRHKYLEVKAIHYWWNVDRKRQDGLHAVLLRKWNEARKNQDPAEHQYWTELKAREEINKDKKEEMIIRLIKIRGVLWT